MSRERTYWVYILASKIGGTLYIGVTSNLVKRIYEHRMKFVPGFTKEYGVHRLVYFEQHTDIEAAIRREKRLKKWESSLDDSSHRRDESNWGDLYPQIASP